LRFFGLEQTVIEIAPGGGWSTEILAPYLRDRGDLYAAHHSADAADPDLRKSRELLVGLVVRGDWRMQASQAQEAGRRP
jgi:predicted methyltransferase